MPRRLEATPDAIARAAAVLRDSGVVALPTETVYGLGAGTLDRIALRRVYELKGRPADNPLIAHVLDARMARTIVQGWDERCAALAERFWPGPLTLVVPRESHVPAEATAGRPTIAVRAPDHAVARALLEAYGGAISAPSANRSGRVSPTTADHVMTDFADAGDLIVLDGGACAIGIESTVLDLTVTPACVLRPGGVGVEALRAMIGEVDAPRIDEQAAGPGTSPRHYAPRTPARLLARATLEDALRSPSARAAVLTHSDVSVPAPHVRIAMPPDAESYAKQLYHALREADDQSCDAILIERPPEEGDLWRTIHDRLRRATAGEGG